MSHKLHIMTIAIFTLVLCPLGIIISATEKHMYGATAAQQQSTTPTAVSDSIPKLPNPEMVLVKGGTYRMGLAGDNAGQGFGSTARTHQVTLSSFKIGKYEVTQAEWQSVMGDSLNF